MKKFLFLAVAIASASYDAEIGTSSGIYEVTVEVSNCSVTQVNWPNGGSPSVTGGDLYCSKTECSAAVVSSRGDHWTILITDRSLAKVCR